MVSKKVVKCPKCKCEIDITRERRESFNCHICNTALVMRKTALPKGEPARIDGRHVI